MGRPIPLSVMPDREYVDHPAPSVDLMAVMLIGIGGVAAALMTMPGPIHGEGLWDLALRRGVPLLVLAILCFYLWPFYSTYYTLRRAGIRVQYGPWTREYPWSDFRAVEWKKGLFATRIGWPSVTPCVRIYNGILFRRKRGWLGLYLTPRDSRAFLQRIAELAPELTSARPIE